MYFDSFDSPLGEIALCASDEGLTKLAFQQGNCPINTDGQSYAPEKFEQCKTQLQQYFDGQRKTFDLTLAPQGTPFQLKVWQVLQTIKFGQTATYLHQAKELGNSKAVRAVGTANGANPIAIIIPCHRVIGSNQKLTGYAGGLGLKAKLLMHEGANFKV